jgi:hypothetical protein
LIWWCNFLFSIMKDWGNYNVLIKHLCRMYNIIAIIMNIIILVWIFL